MAAEPGVHGVQRALGFGYEALDDLIHRLQFVEPTHTLARAGIGKGLDAMLLDGGGSAALMVEGDFVSAPFKGKKSSARDMSNALGVVRLPQTKK